jgi:hypothetical protein
LQFVKVEYSKIDDRRHSYPKRLMDQLHRLLVNHYYPTKGLQTLDPFSCCVPASFEP